MELLNFIVPLRAREKLYEELLMDEEGMQDTANNRIHIGKPIEFDEKEFLIKVEQLCNEVSEEVSNIRELVQELVQAYHYKNR